MLFRERLKMVADVGFRKLFEHEAVKHRAVSAQCVAHAQSLDGSRARYIAQLST